MTKLKNKIKLFIVKNEINKISIFNKLNNIIKENKKLLGKNFKSYDPFNEECW